MLHFIQKTLSSSPHISPNLTWKFCWITLWNDLENILWHITLIFKYFPPHSCQTYSKQLLNICLWETRKKQWRIPWKYGGFIKEIPPYCVSIQRDIMLKNTLKRHERHWEIYSGLSRQTTPEPFQTFSGYYWVQDLKISLKAFWSLSWRYPETIKDISQVFHHSICREKFEFYLCIPWGKMAKLFRLILRSFSSIPWWVTAIWVLC